MHLRFPSILRIENEAPSSFQDAIRAQYPFFEEKSLGFPSPMPGPISVKIGLAGLPASSYEFSSPDRNWVISLTKEWIALTCREYSKWSEFADRLQPPLEAFQKQYSPAFYVRSGLRYQNIIQRSQLGLDGEAWSGLINPKIAGVLSCEEFTGSIEQSWSDFVICEKNGRDRLHLQHGLATKQTADLADEVYVLDLDIYTQERMSINDANTKLKSFNNEAGKVFRWCIGDRLHEALRPAAVE